MAQQFDGLSTGHDATGRAVVTIDEVAANQVSARPGATAWRRSGLPRDLPVDNNGEEDQGLRKTGTTLDNGTVFRILELAPGSARATIETGLDRLRRHHVGRGRHGSSTIRVSI